jgi:esterase/lipase
MKNKVGFNSLGKRLVGEIERPLKYNGRTVLLLHGLTNSMEDCPLINQANLFLLRKGYSTFRFDYFGSGESPGFFKNKTFKILYRNTLDAYNFIRDEIKHKDIGLWGRSLGAILASTICDREHVFATAIISSTMHTKESFSSFFPKKNTYSLPLRGTGAIKGEPVLPYDFYKETDWIDRMQRNHLANAKNVIVIQGTNDKIINNLNWTQEIYSTIKGNKKLELIEGADHSYKGLENQVIEKIVGWFDKNAYSTEQY